MTRQFSIIPSKKVCAKRISFNIDDDKIIHEVHFQGGCPGLTVAISKLLEGQKAENVVQLLSDVKCLSKDTSCAAQLAKGIKEAVETHN